MQSLGLEFAHPAALALLALPAALLLLARRADRPPALFTGAFELWARIARERPAGARDVRRRVPPPLWPFAFGLACAALAAAGPRPSTTETWSVLVDRTGSMYLAADGAATRLERAERLLHERLGVREYAWVDVGADPPEIVRARALPAAWREAPTLPRAAVDWSAHDVAGSIWLTDAGGDLAPRHATLCASGGAPVPGLVATRGDVAIEWDGTALVERAGAAPPTVVAAELAESPAVALLARAWIDARHLRTGAATEDGVVLRVVEHASSAPARAVEFGRDGWRARAVVRAPAPLRDELGPLSVWLAADDGTPLVSAGPGRIAVALEGEPAFEAGDAAFAVSFAALFDASVLPARGVVALAERAAAGEPRFVAGDPPAPTAEDRATAARVASGLALAALGLVLLAILWIAAPLRAGDAARAGG